MKENKHKPSIRPLPVPSDPTTVFYNNADILRVECFQLVSAKGRNLKRMDSAFTEDEDIVLAAVTQDGCALEFAAKELQRNRRLSLLLSLKIGGHYNMLPKK